MNEDNQRMKGMKEEHLNNLIDHLEKDIKYYQEKKDNLEKSFKADSKELEYVITNHSEAYLALTYRIRYLNYLVEGCNLLRKDEKKGLPFIRKEILRDLREEVNSLSDSLTSQRSFSMEAVKVAIRLKVLTSLFEMGAPLYALESILQGQ